MRVRIILFDDVPYEGTDPTVIQSLDVPIEGRPDPGPGPTEGDIRIPGTNIRLRVVFLKNDRPEPIGGNEAIVYQSAGGKIVAEAIVTTDGQLRKNAELETMLTRLPVEDVVRLFAIAGSETFTRRMRDVGTDMTEDQMVSYLVTAIRDFHLARPSDG